MAGGIANAGTVDGIALGEIGEGDAHRLDAFLHGEGGA